MLNKTWFKKKKISPKRKVQDWLLQKTQVSFNSYALITTKFEVDKNHYERFVVNKT